MGRSAIIKPAGGHLMEALAFLPKMWLEFSPGKGLGGESMKRLTVDDFRAALHRKFVSGQRAGKAAVEVNSGDLHREVGVYPERGHSMPTCCNVMWEAKTDRDTVISSPPKKRGASLTIRYALPR